ncbi:hypothetical protein GIB67_019496 [Kingdonia uniflora]|uniref:GAGA-binding transcriptional activator n=1 Tax=Kingdonia uniflora TaxID=39325 RepID=A0A7J7N0A1_9MAGN|nr:hypothetical protein GIB67_019496 [Kingdonia uniflora]
MDGSSHRENGRYKQEQNRGLYTQWTIPPHMMKDPQALSLKFISIINERDSALHERDAALTEKKTALAERDMAILQRDAAIAQRDNAIMERANAIEAYEYRESSTAITGNSPSTCSLEGGTPRWSKYHYAEPIPVSVSPPLPVSTSASEPVKRRKSKQPKEAKSTVSKTAKKRKRRGEDLNKELVLSNPGAGDWKDQDSGLNQVTYDETTMPVPVCSCTGNQQQCYKWGQGGWQSACCTTTLSLYPLPVMPNKRHNRVGGRKMSGAVFNKLLSRFAANGHDLSKPIDLKDHWAKHGTNRYITIK